jgi:hypothetical protein
VDGQLTPKHVIASRSLNAVLDRLQAVASGPESSRAVIDAGLVSFEGDHAAVALKLEPFNANRFRSWVKAHGKPQRGTPLGDAVRLAGQAVLKSALPRKHVLVITDGINTQGPDPTETIPGLQKSAGRSQNPLSFHFVAFDVNASVFDGVKKLGATVLGAADEKQLQTQLEFIVSKKILLEDEEPPVVRPKPNQ